MRGMPTKHEERTKMKNQIALLSVLTIVGPLACNLANPTSGDKIGQIAKVQEAGLFCKTNEILVTGKFGGGELHLTVPQALLARAKDANEKQTFVKVTYHADFVNSVCSNETGNQWLDSVTDHPVGAAQ